MWGGGKFPLYFGDYVFYKLEERDGVTEGWILWEIEILSYFVIEF